MRDATAATDPGGDEHRDTPSDTGGHKGRSIGRRRFLQWTGATVGVGVLAAVGGVGWAGFTYLRSAINTIGTVDFSRRLTVPPIAASRVEGATRVFDLVLQAGRSDLGQSAVTPTWGINGAMLGPTIRATRGEHVRLQVTNKISEASTLHWHGMHLPAVMDGGPHQMIAPGDTWTPEWVVDQPAATLWYHPHPHGQTAEHVYRGLAGLFIIDDPAEAALDLPRTYGIDDIPLIVQDRKFHDDGTLDMSTSFMQATGIIGDTILVNGAPTPHFDVTTHTIRLRILNGSNTRPYTFAFEDHRAFHVIATDGGLLPRGVALDNIPLSPGERAEIVVTFTRGEQVRLQSGPTVGGDRLAGGEDHLDIIQFRAADQLGGLTRIPDTLVDMPVPDETVVARTRDFELSGYSINGRSMDMSRIDDVVTLGDTEVWTILNVDGQTHNFHIHDVQFHILDIDGTEPPAHLQGRKDTVWMPHGKRVRLIMEFTDHASDETPYMYHCHMLRHEDNGMMGQFLVVEPGRSTDPADYGISPVTGPGHHHG
ncbi:Multicopper oxidase with three cupredoxin domains (includes cell division protein FtsP and spore coat protein CotA) [Microbacterium azadirachtae]|uniref:Multicopper oxidase CueO n=1 Tax=Microbacterium azadirachtae TaxID=582680 RepID=A0A1I6G908_9MICO|nr:multicopper oxidase domain-containing protein [Microbacterium azadirachtae]SFR38674.1 Multicopper oxidase with three cupredoxin domains (includes cell division protein FtsP and spore coat protein CotA) [Microbacterium azadirachtae]